MATEPHALSAQQRLSISRRALVNQLQGARPTTARATNPYTGQPRRTNDLDPFPLVSLARKVGERWWRRHPANAIGHLAQPLLERYAQEQPFKLVAVAAAVGGLAVLVKPWRLLSVTTVLAAALKTSDVADVVTALLHNAGSHKA